MTEDQDKWRKYVHGVANPQSRMAKEQNRTQLLTSGLFAGVLLFTGNLNVFIE